MALIAATGVFIVDFKGNVKMVSFSFPLSHFFSSSSRFFFLFVLLLQNGDHERTL